MKSIPLSFFLLPLICANSLAADPPDAPHEKDHPPSIPLWPNGAPGSDSRKDQREVVTMRKEPDTTFAVISNIHNPSITPFLPEKGKSKGAAIIVAPGGGHAFLTIDREGYDVGRWFAERGVACFVLKYRLARDQAGPSGYKVEVDALADAQRAIRIVRSRADEWGINPKAVGIMGFSAGGQLAALASMHNDSGKPDAADAIDKFDCKPNFQILIYPGLGGVTMSKDTPPTWMLAANDDRLSEGCASAYLALRKAGVPAELHIFAHGGHGFGLRDKQKPVFGWPALLNMWLDDMGFLKKN